MLHLFDLKGAVAGFILPFLPLEFESFSGTELQVPADESIFGIVVLVGQDVSATLGSRAARDQRFM